ncbi:MAG TPA: hypothetical protein VFT75_18450 [Nocardioidaceae bacterium]|nr:hypothetical protein [Nocardioidaceae bacterium]
MAARRAGQRAGRAARTCWQRLLLRPCIRYDERRRPYLAGNLLWAMFRNRHRISKMGVQAKTRGRYLAYAWIDDELYWAYGRTNHRSLRYLYGSILTGRHPSRRGGTRGAVPDAWFMDEETD